MTNEDFVKRNNRIVDMLNRIANRTEQMALLGTADFEHPEFIELMRVQERLFIAAEKLLNTYELQYSK